MSTPRPVQHTAPPLVVLGLDAFEVEWLERWVAEGRLPFLSSLLARSTFARVRSAAFADAPWPSLFSGTSPGHHAFFTHLQVPRGTYRVVRTNARTCHRLPFWHHLRGTGRRAALLDVPKSYPLEGVDGVQISAWGEHYPLLPEPQSSPPHLIGEIVSRFGAYPHVDERPSPPSRRWERRALRTFLANVDRKAEAAEFLLSSEPWDLFFAVFAEVHYAEHQFLHLADPAHWAFEPDAPADLRDALASVASRLDAAVERLCRRLPAGANLVVISVHGIEPNCSANFVVEDILRALGLLAPPAAAAPPAGAVEGMLRRTQAIRALTPAPIRGFINRRLVDGTTHDRAMADAFASSADWSRTQAFLLPSDHFQAFISLNLRGREPQGIVERGAEASALATRISHEFLRLTDADSGRPIVSAVECVPDRYPGPHASDLPDIVVHWAGNGPIRRVAHPEFGTFETPPVTLRKSQHTTRGFLMASGPAFPPAARVSEVNTIDVAPTLLRLMGLPSDPDMEGCARLDLLTADRFVGDGVLAR